MLLVAQDIGQRKEDIVGQFLIQNARIPGNLALEDSDQVFGHLDQIPCAGLLVGRAHHQIIDPDASRFELLEDLARAVLRRYREASRSVAGGRRTSLKKLVLAVDELAAISFKVASCQDGVCV